MIAADFTIRIDGQLVTIADPDVTLPPVQDPNQKLSVVFVMDYSTSVTTLFRPQMEAAVIAFIDEMKDGEQAAVVKFNADNPLGASIVAPFTAIDTVGGNATLETAVSVGLPGRWNEPAGCHRSRREPHPDAAGRPSRGAQGSHRHLRRSRQSIRD